jgi:hypothetical protein
MRSTLTKHHLPLALAALALAAMLPALAQAGTANDAMPSAQPQIWTQQGALTRSEVREALQTEVLQAEFAAAQAQGRQRP